MRKYYFSAQRGHLATTLVERTKSNKIAKNKEKIHRDGYLQKYAIMRMIQPLNDLSILLFWYYMITSKLPVDISKEF